MENVSLVNFNSSNEDYQYYEYINPPSSLVNSLWLLYGITSLIAVVGNLLVVYVIAASRGMHSITYCLITNLSVADLIIGLFAIPFQFHPAVYQRWLLPHFMCCLCPFIATVSVNVSIFSLTTIALDRYLAIVHPFKRISKNSYKIILFGIWVIGIGMALPNAVSFYVVEDNRYSNKEIIYACTLRDGKEDIISVYTIVLIAAQYVLPLLIIAGTYFRLSRVLQRTHAPGNPEARRDKIALEKKKKVVKMFWVVIATFAACWGPLQLYQALQFFIPRINLYEQIKYIWISFHWLAMSNSCYNPFIYVVFNEKFKQEIQERFRLKRCLNALTDSRIISRLTRLTIITSTRSKTLSLHGGNKTKETKFTKEEDQNDSRSPRLSPCRT